MKIVGARVAVDAITSLQKDIYVRNNRIDFSPVGKNESVLDLSGYLLLPGLINAHDHLELNLFPFLGSGHYRNAKEWATDVYRPSASPVKEQRALGKAIRLIWGGLKNLLSGVTTVAHHNRYDPALDDPAFPVRVVRQFGWAHSLDFSPNLVERYLETPPAWPFFIHAAEGTDSHARSEIRELGRLGLLSDRTVLVHGIGIDRRDLSLLQARRSSVAWCPSSNLSLYGKTLRPSVLRSGIGIALGTDSAMTSQGDFCDEMALARTVGRLDPAELYQLVTTQAARVLRLRDGQGSILNEGVADLIAVVDRGQSPAASLDTLQIEMMMVGGRVKLASAVVLDRSRKLPQLPHSIELEARGKWFTDIDIPALFRQTVDALGADFRLAGKRVAQGVT